jgi:hypothetical protein
MFLIFLNFFCLFYKYINILLLNDHQHNHQHDHLHILLLLILYDRLLLHLLLYQHDHQLLNLHHLHEYLYPTACPTTPTRIPTYHTAVITPVALLLKRLKCILSAYICYIYWYVNNKIYIFLILYDLCFVIINNNDIFFMYFMIFWFFCFYKYINIYEYQHEHLHILLLHLHDHQTYILLHILYCNTRTSNKISYI